MARGAPASHTPAGGATYSKFATSLFSVALYTSTPITRASTRSVIPGSRPMDAIPQNQWADLIRPDCSAYQLEIYEEPLRRPDRSPDCNDKKGLAQTKIFREESRAIRLVVRKRLGRT